MAPHSEPYPPNRRTFLSCFAFVGALPARLLKAIRPLPSIPSDSFPIGTLKFIAAGKSSAVYSIDRKRVLKAFHEHEDGELEYRAYERLRSHPNIAKILGIMKDGSIVLERGTSLRSICRDPTAADIPIQTKVKWLRHAARGYQHLHSCNIVHGDVGCNNLILTRKNIVKLIDFEGCSIDGGEAGSCYEWFSYRPSIPSVSQRTDVFAFGCAIYEVVTGRPPHYDLESSRNQDREVEQRYIDGHFPIVADLPMGQLMQSCWLSNHITMSEVVQTLEAFVP
ncbi:kinase-like protein [Pseudovirgaria hyperparasitica]|uniref:Kinase-like protein n=1 Tax=Pseudovirgaria hyperparasitica TaxID=470096 RepID=A0A6A6VSN1_9PEZI|nr:kinase-like protein [Pseudovirgaria hyperparasitica]KAF2753678.1 kinase-like protein [Pseudovirgaria hyperparasitica]